MSFSASAINQLKYYVYMLCDENNTPFYIGKGKDNRIFKHEEETIDSTHNLQKYLKIQELLKNHDCVNKYIVHSGLSEDEAFACELALIKMLRFRGINLLNIQNGHEDLFPGCLTPAQIETRAGELKVTKSIFRAEDKVVLYVFNPDSKFDLTKKVHSLQGHGFSFFRGKESPKIIAIFHKKILEGVFSIDSEQYDEPHRTNNQIIYPRLKITHFYETDLYKEFIGYEFTDIPNKTQYRTDYSY